jgi:hypothetical protein
MENKNILWKWNTHRSRAAPYPRDGNLKNGSRRKGERDTHAKQQQGKAWATKAQQDWPVNVAINSRLLICKAEVGGTLYYAKPVLKVDPYFQVLALNLL